MMSEEMGQEKYGNLNGMYIRAWKGNKRMKLQFVMMMIVLFVISCAGATVKDQKVKPPMLSKKEKEVLMQLVEVGAAVGSAMIQGTFKDGLLYKVVK